MRAVIQYSLRPGLVLTVLLFDFPRNIGQDYPGHCIPENPGGVGVTSFASDIYKIEKMDESMKYGW